MKPIFNDAATGSPTMVTATGPPEDRTPGETALRYQAVRDRSHELCEPLEVEDFVVQSMPDVSPTKWHLAHTSWFFETFLLAPHLAGYAAYHPQFRYLFNSYYNAIGEQYSRPDRGLLTRPTTAQVFEYREHVDRGMALLFERVDESRWPEIASLVEIGLNHEQQHQELMLTDLKHVLACNPVEAVYRPENPPASRGATDLRWKEYGEGLFEIGHRGPEFAFDNESPRHRVFLESFEIGSRLVTNGEFLDFIEDGGYERPEPWLSDAWRVVRERGWRAPLYWRKKEGRWVHMTLAGEREVRPEEPLCHASYYEADAYARWAGARLPSEAEWEIVASAAPVEGNFVERGHYHPTPAASEGVTQLFGDVWEWTETPYRPYPGFRPPEGALGEYNAKFMCNQMVLRGGSCATPADHVRVTYRNFFPPDARWQFSGLRLARDLEASR